MNDVVAAMEAIAAELPTLGARPAIRLRLISLGAGRQSTAMALMAAHGEIGPMPDGAIFADTGDEGAATYRHLKWLHETLPFPIYLTSAGRLSEQILAGNTMARPPCFIASGGMVQRQCTRNFKIRPIRRKYRELLGLGPRSGTPRHAVIEQWIGISFDEAIRKKSSGVLFIENRWPLLEKEMTVDDCVTWLMRHGYPVPGKSSCVYCPMRGDRQWQEMRASAPDDWHRAIAFDAALRSPAMRLSFRGEVFVHRSRLPLAAAVPVESPRSEPNRFLDECEGACGL